MNLETMYAAVDRSNDHPRGAHLAAAFADMARALLYLGGNLDNEGEIDRRINKGSINQRNGYLVAAFFLRPAAFRTLLLRRLRHQLVELLEGELLSADYCLINRGWVWAVFLVAQRIGDAEVAALALEIAVRVATIEAALECPADAHPELRLVCVAPGGRTGDRNGIAPEREAGRDIETTGRPRGRMPTTTRYVEGWMLLHFVETGELPRIAPRPTTAGIGTRWVLDIRYFERGHVAGFRSMERGIGCLDKVSVAYDLPPADGGVKWRRGAAVESAGWDTWAERWKGSSPPGWNLPWREGAPALPDRDLGRFLREVTVGDGSPAPPPPPPPPPPGPKKPKEKPGPEPGGELTIADLDLARGGDHALMVDRPGKPRAFVNLLPNGTWKPVRLA